MATKKKEEVGKKGCGSRYSVRVGAFRMAGPVSSAHICTLGQPCSIALQGHEERSRLQLHFKLGGPENLSILAVHVLAVNVLAVNIAGVFIARVFNMLKR